MDVKQRQINRVHSYSTANIGTSSNSAFLAQLSMIVPSSSCAPVAQTNSSGSSSYTPTIHTGPMSKGVEENLALMNGLISCYNALITGELATPVLMNELDQIHPDDVEEIDISWYIGMAVFRAKKVTQRTGKNAWGVQGDRKMGLNKRKLRCYNCHKEGHIAREYTKHKAEYN